MARKAVVLSPRAAERHESAARLAEVALAPRTGRVPTGPRISGAHNNFAAITSTTKTDIYYPGTWYRFNPADGTLSAEIDIWVVDVNGVPLSTAFYYFARLEGSATAGGSSRPVYVTDATGGNVVAFLSLSGGTGLDDSQPLTLAAHVAIPLGDVVSVKVLSAGSPGCGVTGFADGADRKAMLLTVDPVSATTCTLYHDTGSAAGNRIYCPGATDLVLSQGDGAVLQWVDCTLDGGTFQGWLVVGIAKAGGGTYTDENAQDAVGGILTDTATIDATYSDATPSITFDVKNDSITFAKMQNVATDSLVGRDTAGTGDPENITLNATLSMTGAGALQRAALTGDVTASAGSNTTTIANSAVTLAKIANAAANSKLVGSGASGSGSAYSEITLGAGLTMTGTTLDTSGGGSGDVIAANNNAFTGSNSFTNVAGQSFTDGTRTVTLCDGVHGFIGNDGATVVQLGNGASGAGYFTHGGMVAQLANLGTFAGRFSDGTRQVDICNGIDNITYSAATPANWFAGIPPTDVWVALDRIAALLVALNGGTGP